MTVLDKAAIMHRIHKVQINSQFNRTTYKYEGTIVKNVNFFYFCYTYKRMYPDACKKFPV